MGLLYPRLLPILLFVVIFLGGCAQQSVPECPACPNPESWSGCGSEVIKTRTSYRCGAETGYTCEGYTEQKPCQTSIALSDKDIEVTISPTLDETVNGIVKVEAARVPPKTTIVKFILLPADLSLGADMNEEQVAKLLIVEDQNPDDGWKAFIDTTKKENGLYSLFVGPTYEGAPDSNPWLAHVQTQVVVKN